MYSYHRYKYNAFSSQKSRSSSHSLISKHSWLTFWYPSWHSQWKELNELKHVEEESLKALLIAHSFTSMHSIPWPSNRFLHEDSYDPAVLVQIGFHRQDTRCCICKCSYQEYWSTLQHHRSYSRWSVSIHLSQHNFHFGPFQKPWDRAIQLKRPFTFVQDRPLSRNHALWLIRTINFGPHSFWCLKTV